MAIRTTSSFTSIAAARVPAGNRRRSLRAAASQDKKEQAPVAAPRVLLQGLGVLAAAQLAFSGNALADVAAALPNSATSSSARAAVNKSTEDAPSFKDIGSALSKQFNTDDPKEVGRALNRATPDVDLTQNPKDLVNQAGRKVQEVLPNTSDAVNLPDLPNPFDKGGATIPRQVDQNELRSKTVGGAKEVQKQASDLGDVAKEAGNKVGAKVNEATGNLSFDIPNPLETAAEKAESSSAESPIKNAGEKISQVASKLPNPGEATKAGVTATPAKGNPIGSGTKSTQLNQTTGDVSLSNPFASGPEKAGQEAKSALKDAGNQAGKLANKVPGPSELGDVAKAKAKEAGRSVQQTTGNISLSNPFASGPEKAGQEAKSALKDAGNQAGKLANKVPGPSELGDVAKAKAKEASRSVQQTTGNVSLSNPFASGPEKAGQEAKSALKDAGNQAGKLANKVPGPSELGDVAKAKAKEAGRSVQQTTGNLSAASVTEDSKGKAGPLTIKDVESSQSEFPSPTEFAKMDRGEAQSAAERFSGETGGNLPRPQDAIKGLPRPSEVLGSKLPSFSLPDPKAAVQKVQEATPNLSDVPNPQDFFDKARDAAKGVASDAKSAVGDAKGAANKNLPDVGKVGKSLPGSGTTGKDLNIAKNA